MQLVDGAEGEIAMVAEQNKCKLKATDVAKYFLLCSDEDAGDLISNLKLQKLVYFAQGYHLALFDKPLFDDPIEAWTHGPVVPTLYKIYNRYGGSPIPRPTVDLDRYDSQTKEFLDEVYCELGQYSAWRLREMAHAGKPWIDAYNSKVSNLITNESMRAHFKKLLKG
jgi:uncharacterized phage-associated protein